MAKGRGDPTAKRRDETDAQYRSRLARERQNQRDREAPIVPIEAQAHGDYRQALIPDPSGQTRNIARTVINRGGTPVERWKVSGKLDTTQQAVIELMLGLWRKAGIKQALTGKYGERIAASSCAEMGTNAQIDARRQLKRIDGYFPGRTKEYLDIFENVVRHDMPAGVAGDAFGHNRQEKSSRALTVVRFVCDVIATHERV